MTIEERAKDYEKSAKALCDFHKIEPSLTGAYKAGYRKAIEKACLLCEKQLKGILGNTKEAHRLAWEDFKKAMEE